ncbi:Protein of unknown function [Bacillus cytotoxicus]|uniref:Uncharacterized protein n=1 Tax=Bacillus cytotoxicus TaxID=580165 RepID=A0AAX2CG06_9BACI|nr:Protein of unknown function [Bacillus cytotoxicus]SCN35489.1 Protein of unknown function [Bacillus cytotoxicus]
MKKMNIKKVAVIKSVTLPR